MRIGMDRPCLSLNTIQMDVYLVISGDLFADGFWRGRVTSGTSSTVVVLSVRLKARKMVDGVKTESRCLLPSQWCWMLASDGERDSAECQVLVPDVRWTIGGRS